MSALAPVAARRPAPQPVQAREPATPPAPELDALSARIDRLEAVLEGLQDAVHREAVRNDRRFDQLAVALRPEQMARSISDDARRRGL